MYAVMYTAMAIFAFLNLDWDAAVCLWLPIFPILAEIKLMAL